MLKVSKNKSEISTLKYNYAVPYTYGTSHTRMGQNTHMGRNIGTFQEISPKLDCCNVV